MKTLKTILMGLMMAITVTAANANDKPAAARFTRNYAISTYIDAFSHGKLNGLNDVVDNTAKFTMLRGDQVIAFSKAETLNFLKQNKGIEQACTTSASVVESNENISVYKVDMKYDGFVRSNYITLANTGDGWKITNVYSVFK